MNTQANKPQTTRMALVQRVNSTRQSLLLVVLFSVVNLFMVIANSGSRFLFTAAFPYFLPQYGMVFDSKRGTTVITPVTYVLAVISIALYALCWYMSKKKRGWLLASLVLFSVDCAFLLFVMWNTQQIVGLLLDILFHAFVVGALVLGVRAEAQLATMPEETPAEPIAQNSPAEKPAADTTATAETAAEEAKPEESAFDSFNNPDDFSK